MKRFLMVLWIICFWSFSVTGCSEAPDEKDTATYKATEDTRKAVKSGIEKIKEEGADAEKAAQQAIEDTEKRPEDVVESTMEGTADIIDEVNDPASDAEKAFSSIIAEESDGVPDVIEMKNTDAFNVHNMGIVMFSHKKHSDAMPDGYGIACGECHHDKDGNPLEFKEGYAVQGCMECHDKADRPKKPVEISKEDWDAMQLEYYYGAIHANCIDCHKTGAAGPVKCAECHPKR